MGNMNPFHHHHSKKTMNATGTKGLTNRPGENNCFLNSAIQVNNENIHVDLFSSHFSLSSRCYGSWTHFEKIFDY